MNKLDKTVKLYKDTLIIESSLDEEVSIGDFSKIKNSTLSKYVRIDRNNHVDGVTLGRYSYTGRNTLIINARIGAFCSISWNVSIGGADHDYNRVAQHSFLYDKEVSLNSDQLMPTYDRYSKPLYIGSDVWIASGVVITRGVSIGHGAVIGANSVVTADIPPYAIAVGSPAKVIKYRFNQAVIQSLLDIEWWNWETEKIKNNFSILSNPPNISILKKILLNDPI